MRTNLFSFLVRLFAVCFLSLLLLSCEYDEEQLDNSPQEPEEITIETGDIYDFNEEIKEPEREEQPELFKECNKEWDLNEVEINSQVLAEKISYGIEDEFEIDFVEINEGFLEKEIYSTDGLCNIPYKKLDIGAAINTVLGYDQIIQRFKFELTNKAGILYNFSERMGINGEYNLELIELLFDMILGAEEGGSQEEIFNQIFKFKNPPSEEDGEAFLVFPSLDHELNSRFGSLDWPYLVLDGDGAGLDLHEVFIKLFQNILRNLVEDSLLKMQEAYANPVSEEITIKLYDLEISGQTFTNAIYATLNAAAFLISYLDNYSIYRVNIDFGKMLNDLLNGASQEWPPFDDYEMLDLGSFFDMANKEECDDSHKYELAYYLDEFLKAIIKVSNDPKLNDVLMTIFCPNVEEEEMESCISQVDGIMGIVSSIKDVVENIIQPSLLQPFNLNENGRIDKILDFVSSLGEETIELPFDIEEIQAPIYLELTEALTFIPVVQVMVNVMEKEEEVMESCEQEEHCQSDQFTWECEEECGDPMASECIEECENIRRDDCVKGCLEEEFGFPGFMEVSKIGFCRLPDNNISFAFKENQEGLAYDFNLLSAIKFDQAIFSEIYSVIEIELAKGFSTCVEECQGDEVCVEENCFPGPPNLVYLDEEVLNDVPSCMEENALTVFEVIQKVDEK